MRTGAESVVVGELERYEKTRAASRVWFERSKAVLPGGISHEIRTFKPFPFAVTSSSGALLHDCDDQHYIDFWMGHYSHIFGHNPPFITAAIREQLERGVMWGTFHPYEVELAELIRELVPSVEQIRFCTTGTEATMFAVRLARGFTNRTLIAKIEGGWHGPSSELFHGVTRDFDRAESLGLPSDRPESVITLPFNDCERSRDILRRIPADTLAAIIVEPMIGSSWFIPAHKEFLSLLRNECDRLGAVLIYDEIITGFRVSPGGAQEYYGILPDMTTLGKVLGGGMPIAAVTGRRDILDRCNPGDGIQKWQRVRIGGGTFSCHPLSVAASLALLRKIRAEKETLYPKLLAAGEQFKQRVTEIFSNRGISVAATGLGSLFTLHFHREHSTTPINPQQAIENCYYNFKEKLLKVMLMNRGIYVMHGGGAISTAHEVDHLEQTLQAFDDVATIISSERSLLEFSGI